MDPLDLRLFRALWRGGAMQIGALDPRLSAAQLAEKAGAPRSTVQARLAQWRASGFFAKSDVWPNPALFGVGTGGIGVVVPEPRDKPAALAAFARVDGVLGAFDHVGPFVALQVIDDGAAAMDARVAALARVRGVERATLLATRAIPRPREPSATSWRALEALRAEPDASLADLGAKLGVSTRTFTRAYADLVDSGAAWSVPLLDFTKFPGVLAKFTLTLADAAARRDVLARLARAWPDLVQHTHEHGRPPPAPDPRVEVFLQFENAAAAGERERELAAWGEVARLEVTFPLRIATYPAWFDERLARGRS